MFRYIRLAQIYIKYQLKSLIVYKGSFLINCVSQAVDYAVTFLLMWVMVSAFGTMGGWNNYEVMLLYAVSLLAYALSGMFFFNIFTGLPEDIHSGAFDDILVKPVSILPFLMCSRFLFNYIAHISLSVVVLVLCIWNLEIELSFLNAVYFIFVLICGSLLYSAFFLFVATLSFFFVKTDALEDIIYFFREVSFYPLSIFPRVIQIIMSVVLPYAMINFFPLQHFLKKSDYLMFDPWIVYVAPVVSILLFVLSVCFFQYGIKKYKSTGS